MHLALEKGNWGGCSVSTSSNRACPELFSSSVATPFSSEPAPSCSIPSHRSGAISGPRELLFLGALAVSDFGEGAESPAGITMITGTTVRDHGGLCEALQVQITDVKRAGMDRSVSLSELDKIAGHLILRNMA